jgi:hypothetical protein
MVVSGTEAVEDVFFCLDSQTLNFDGSSLQQRKCFATEGLLLGGFRIEPLTLKIARLS